MRAELLPHIRPLFPPSKSIPWTGSPPHTHTTTHRRIERKLIELAILRMNDDDINSLKKLSKRGPQKKEEQVV
jgi:hypothetical protein